MTAEEIRKYQLTGEGTSFPENPIPSLILDVAILLREFTAQLADLNEHLEIIDAEVFDVKLKKRK
jgi:hypothetical protein